MHNIEVPPEDHEQKAGAPAGRLSTLRQMASERRKARASAEKREKGGWRGGSGNAGSASASKAPVVAKTKEQASFILAALGKRAPFDSLDVPSLRLIVNAMSIMQSKPADVIVKEGDQV